MKKLFLLFCLLLHVGWIEAQTAGLSSPILYAIATGSVNVLAVVQSGAVLKVGQVVVFLPNIQTTSTTPTLNVNSLGAATITKLGTTALASGDLTSTAIATVIYDGTNWQLQNPQTASSGGGAVSSVSNSDGTLTISPTTGGVVGSIALGHANTWTALQTFGTNISIGGVTATGATGTGNVVFSASPTFTGVVTAPAITLNGGSFTGTQCLEEVSGVITVTGSGCSGSITGLTIGYMTKAGSSTSVVNSLCDEGITTSNVMTCTDTGGITGVSFQTSGSGAGQYQAYNSAGTFYTAWSSAATANNTIQGPATVPTNGDFFYCVVSGQTCLLTDSGTLASALASVVAHGTTALTTSSIASGTCTVSTTSASGVATTHKIIATPNVDPTGVTGYAVSTSGSLYIWSWPTSGNVNFKVCNQTANPITPGALTMNWSVI